MTVKISVNFSKVYKAVKRLQRGHRAGFQAANQDLLRYVRYQRLTGGTTATKLAVRSGKLRRGTKMLPLKGDGGYWYGGLSFYARSSPVGRRYTINYALPHISRYPKENPNLPYDTRVHLHEIINQRAARMVGIIRSHLRRGGGASPVAVRASHMDIRQSNRR